MALGPWNRAAMAYEMAMFRGDWTNSAHFVGGVVMGMAIATQHPEYAQAAVRLSQVDYERERPNGEKFNVGVARFIQAVPIELHDEEKE